MKKLLIIMIVLALASTAYAGQYIQILKGKANMIVVEPENLAKLREHITILDPKDYTGVKQGDIYDSETNTFTTPEPVVVEPVETVTLKTLNDKMSELEAKIDAIKTETAEIKEQTKTGAAP